MTTCTRFFCRSSSFASLPTPLRPNAQVTKSEWQSEWRKILDGARKEGEVTASIAAKEPMSVKEFLKVENQSEEKLDRVRELAQKFAHALFK